MAQKIHPADLEKLPVYKDKVGGTASSSGASGTPTEATDADYNPHGAHYKPGDVDKHFKVDNNPRSFDVVPVFKDPMTMELKFGSPGSTENILYLPYHLNCIVSINIPKNLDKSVCYFATFALSGCNFFIDQRRSGDLVCYHANAKRYSPQETAVRENPAATSELAEGTMDALHTKAQKSGYSDVTKHKRLQASEYYAVPKAEVERERESRKGVQFFGGTTVMGFRVKDQWEFWFQTYGRITCDKVGIANAPYKVFEARPFWP